MDTANESLQFQKVSALGLALEKVFQEVIDYKNTVPFDDQKELVFKYCKNTFANKIRKAYKDTINLTIDDIYLVKSVGESAGILLGDTEESEKKIYSLLDNSYGYKKISTASKELTEILELYKSVDSRTGKLDNVKFTDGSITASLWIPISSFFLLHHHVSPEIVEELTAKEMAAVFLHETGHHYSLLERFQYTYLVNNRITTQLSLLSDKYSATEIAEVILDNEKELANIANNDKNAKALVVLGSKCASTLLYLNERQEDTTNDSLYLTYRLLSTVIWFIFFNIFFKLLLTPFTTFLGMFNYSEPMTSSTKHSDTVFTMNSYKVREQDADEYMVRSGYGKEFISFTSKMDKLFTYLSTMKSTRYTSQQLKDIKHNHTLLKLLTGFYKYSIYNKDYIKYESDIDRCKTICRMHIQGLKDLPTEEQWIWLKRYESCIAELQKLEKESSSNITLIMRFIESVVIAPSKLVDSLLCGKVNKDYEKLQKQIEEIVNNKLYFYGLKLKQLGR